VDKLYKQQKHFHILHQGDYLKLFIIILFFITKLLDSFSQDWELSAKLEGTNVNPVFSLLDDDRNTYVYGEYNTSLITTDSTYNSQGLRDIYFLKIDTLGQIKWINSIGSASNDFTSGIAVDDTGNFYISGFFINTIYFTPTYSLSTTGSFDFFLAKYNSSGEFEWAKNIGIGIDFNSTLFSHPKADSGFTLSDNDKGIRDFWIEHVKRCREIAAYLGKELGTRSVHNIWIPDGSKDITVNRYKHRAHLKDSLDKILADKQDPKLMADSVEAKLFGIGVEAYTVGSHEFYLGYTVDKKMMLCLDIGHFHPTEQVSDKVSAVFQFIPELLFHVTRPIRWDSDHVVTLSDEVRALFEEIVWADKLDKVAIGLDFFDASINRIGAYVVGTRAAQKAILLALLNPTAKLREYDDNGQNFERLALLEEAKSMPFGAVWDYYCQMNNVPVGTAFISEIQQYEKDVLSKR